MDRQTVAQRWRPSGRLSASSRGTLAGASATPWPGPRTPPVSARGAFLRCFRRPHEEQTCETCRRVSPRGPACRLSRHRGRQPRTPRESSPSCSPPSSSSPTSGCSTATPSGAGTSSSTTAGASSPPSLPAISSWQRPRATGRLAASSPPQSSASAEVSTGMRSSPAADGGPGGAGYSMVSARSVRSSCR